MKKKVWNISSLKKAFFNWVHLHRLSQDPGATCMHQQWHTRYSYDKVSNICRPFNYSGCEGNSNNFDSLYACQHTCKVALPHNSPARRQPNDLIEKCQMPRDHGKCHLGNLHPLAFTRNEGETRTQSVFKITEKVAFNITSEASYVYISLKMPKMVHFGEFLKTWNLRSNSVTRKVNFNRTKIGEKY